MSTPQTMPLRTSTSTAVVPSTKKSNRPEKRKSTHLVGNVPSSKLTKIAFTERDGDDVRVGFTWYNIPKCVAATGKSATDLCWEVALSYKTADQAHKSCLSPSCRASAGSGRHAPIFKEMSIPIMSVKNAAKTTAFYDTFNGVRPSFL